MKAKLSITECYENLANAIIVQATEDYRKANKRLAKFPHDAKAEKKKDRLLDFFYSGWFSALTEINPQYLIDRLDAECK